MNRSAMRLLIIAEDKLFARKLKNGLRQVPFTVDVSNSIEQGLYWVRTTNYDLITIEHSKGCDALTICKQIRAGDNNSLILVATESLSSKDAVNFFNLGVDDYVSKFGDISEITVRIKALLRRPRQLQTEKYVLGDITVDCQTYEVTKDNQSIHLTKKEFGLLEYLLRHQNRVLSRTDLIEHVWDIHADLFSNSLETHILNLRKKLESPGKPKLIHTISGRGYRLALQS